MTMSTAELVIAIVLLSAVGFLLIRELQRRRTENSITPAATRILFPFAGEALSIPALDAALRLARAEGATLVPAYLAVVPLNVALDTPLKKEAEAAMPLLEAVEQRAMAAGVSVDSRIERGRTVRHALRRLIDEESFDRIVVAGATNGHDGFTSEDVAWLLEHAEAEIVILRPARKRGNLAQSSRDERRNERVRRVLFRMPEHAQREVPVG
jgi:hypothetical protein